MYNFIVLTHVACKQAVHFYDLIQGPRSDFACYFFPRYSPLATLINIWRISEGDVGHTADLIHSFSSSCNFFHICQVRTDTGYMANK